MIRPVRTRKIRKPVVPLTNLRSKKVEATAARSRKITINVPDAPVSVAIPETISFYIDTRFTTSQVNRLRTMIVGLLGFWNGHFTELNDGAQRSRYQNCVNQYARFNLSPVWFDEKIANGAAAAAVQMDGLTTMIAANGFGRAPKAYIKYQKSGNFTIKGVNASNPELNSLSITVNASALSLTSVSTAFLTGSLHHAWLHREGYRHPAGKFTSYFAGESSMCLMRGNSNKTPGTSVSAYTDWLD